MKYSALFIAALLALPCGMAMARAKATQVPPPPANLDGMKACPHKGADAMINIDKSLSKGSAASHVTLLCLDEYVKYLEARVTTLEAAKAH
jgi:hypothetical protein